MRRGNLFFIAAIIVLCAPLMAYDWSTNPGVGSAGNPYQISTPEQLMAIGNDAVLLTKYYILTNDIVFDPINNPAHVFTTALIAPGTAFTGSFNGQNHSITNVKVNGSSYVGLFGKIGSSGKVLYVNIVNCNIYGSSDYAGGLAGLSSGTITNCSVSGSVRGKQYAGGLLGRMNSGTINNCQSSAGVAISTSYGNNYAGGLIAYSDGGRILGCFATGGVSGDQYIGGFVGFCQADITECYARGNVSFWQSGAGFAVTLQNSDVSCCYSTGLVSGSSGSIGGFAGSSYSTNFTSCFYDIETSGGAHSVLDGAIGKTTTEMKDISTFKEAGWRFADFKQAVPGWYMPANSYPALNFQNPSTTCVPNVRGLTSAQAGSALVNAGFTVSGTQSVRSVVMAQGKVTGLSVVEGGYLLNGTAVTLYVSSGKGTSNGTAANPWPIACLADVESLAQATVVYDECFIMTADVYFDADKIYQTAVIGPLGTTAFTGTFDGNGHKIVNLCINTVNDAKDYVGLFGKLDHATVKNLSLENVWVGGDNYVGGLAGYSLASTTTNCSSNGAAYVPFGYDYNCAGLLIGINDGGSISYCSASGYVAGAEKVGGLAGSNTGSIHRCSSDVQAMGTSFEYGGIGSLLGRNEPNGCVTDSYATGQVLFYSDNQRRAAFGGLVGSNYGSINRCFATGDLICTDTYSAQAAGGLSGRNFGNISNSYSTGDLVNIKHTCGGIVGANFSGSIYNCYSTGTVSGTSAIGGLAGMADDVSGLPYQIIVEDSFWNLEAAGTDIAYTIRTSVSPLIYEPVYSTPGAAEGKTTAEMMSMATFTAAGWDFSDSDGDASDWMMLREGEDYPRLAWQEVFAGDIAGMYGVDLVDLEEIARNWLESCSGNCEDADVDESGRVGLGDFAAIAGQWMMQ